MKKTFIFQFTIWTLISFSAVAQTSSAWKAKVDSVVLKKAETSATFEFIVVLKQQADVSAADNLETKEEKAMFVYNSLKAAVARSQTEITELLTRSKATFQSFWIINCVLVTADLKTLEEVANLASVESIIENAKYVVSKTVKSASAESELGSSNAVEWGISKTKANQVWTLGYKGAGAVVGGEDTGYDWKHPAIKKQYRGWNGSAADHNFNWHDAIHAGGSNCGANSKEPCDDQEHGTHTMGTMVGEDGANQIGMAPAAKWIGCRNMNENVGAMSSYIECFQFFLAPTDLSNNNADPSKSPHVINNSWGCPTSEGCNSSNFATMEKVVNNLRAAGVVVVASAGNDGPGCSTINTAAPIFKGSFTIGSTTSGDGISDFSSRGPVANYGGHISPDVSAPGSGIRSSVPGGGYASMSGTSMAGPHVAGLVALIISANPALAGQVSTIEDIIQSTAVKLTSSQNCGGTSGSSIPNNTFGWGRIDALAAVKKAITSVSVNKNNKSAPIVDAFPNPFSGAVTFEFKNWKSGTTLEIYTITGSIVGSKTWEATPSVFEFDLSNQASGAYFYRVTNEKESINGKLFKVSE